MRIVFVLVGTSHSGNLGAVARAIKTMGFDELRLVDTCSPESPEALARASGAQDVLESAARFGRLGEAIADCRAVYGASARARGLSVPMLDSREACEMLVDGMDDMGGGVDTAAVVFGRERSGLTNEELDLCTRHLHIPSNPAFSSLNLGAAVQVVAYELAQARIRRAPARGPGAGPDAVSAYTLGERSQAGKRSEAREIEPPADGAAMEHLFEHLQRVMLATGFLDPANPRHLMRRVRGYFERNRPSDNELAILRGILSATERPKRRDSGPARHNRDHDHDRDGANAE